MKDIEKLLADGRKDVLPDDDVKQNIKERLGFSDAPQTLAYAHGGVKTHKRNLFIALAATALAIILCLIIVLPIVLGNDGKPSDIRNKFSDITDANSFYAYGAASVGSLLASDLGGQSEKASAFSAFSKPLKAASTVSTADIDPYISLIESLLSENNIESENIAGAEGYAYGMAVKCIGLSGESVSYSMYYDKIFLKDKNEDDKQESSYAIKGVLHAGDKAYPVEGTYETETEKDGQECELYFKAYTGEGTDKKSFIEVERESETEEDEQEYEYVYSVYERGKLVEKTSIKYENEEGKTELELIMEKDGATQKLKFETETSGSETVLSGKGEIDGNKVKFRVYGSGSNRRYEFYD